MPKRGSYLRSIAIISGIFIFFIIFLTIVNLYVGLQLRKIFLDSQQGRVYLLAQLCASYLNLPHNERLFKSLAEAFDIRYLVITDSLGNKLYDSHMKFLNPGIDYTKVFSKLPEAGTIIQEGDNLVYHNPEPNFFLFLFEYPVYTKVDRIFHWHLSYITLSLVLISALGFLLIRNLFLPMRYVAGVAQKYGIEIKKEDFVPATFNEIFDKLKEKEKELLEFSAYIAHEFRNSLATITGLARLVQKGKKDPEEIIKECSVMEGMIAGLLEYARPLKLIKGDVELSTLIEEAIKRTKIPRRIILEKELQYKEKIKADYDMLLGAIINLLKNAAEAITDTGKIKITTFGDENLVSISIADTGKGIPEDALKNIFSPFYSTKKRGIGIGLPFVKKVVELHNGRLTVKSAPNKGSEFIIKIPILLEQL